MMSFWRINRTKCTQNLFTVLVLLSYCNSFGEDFGKLTSVVQTNSIVDNPKVNTKIQVVKDTKLRTSPTISCPANISQNIDLGLCWASILTPNPIIDNDYLISSLSWKLEGATAGTSSTTGINYLGTQQFNKGITIVTYTAIDDASNSATCSYTVTIIDNQAPVFTYCPTISSSLCTENEASYTKNGINWNAIAVDICGEISSVTYALSGSTTGTGISLDGVAFNVGTTTVTWTATDTLGNSSNCVFLVTIVGSPIITSQPIAQLDCEGASVNFTVVASGSGLTYSWQYKKPLDTSYISIISNSINVDGFNKNKIKIDNVGSTQFPTGTQFKAIVTSSTGCSVTSSAATLLVNEIKGISPSATNVTQCYGTNYDYTVSTSTPSSGYVVSYQWKNSVASGVWNDVVNGDHFSGATTATLNIVHGTPAESASYRVYITFHSSGADCNINSFSRTRQITFLPLLNSPTTTITQPDCVAPTGSVLLGNLPSIGNWTLTRSPGNNTISATGTSTLVTGLAPGKYTYTITSGTCTSAPSADIEIQAATAAIWDGSSWTNGPPNINQAIEFKGNYSSVGDLAGCSCIVTSGTVVFNPNHSLKISNWLHVNGGKLTFENDASLVQVNNVLNTNIGTITYKRNLTKITKMDYTYWSTPVMPFSLGKVSANTLGDQFYSYDSSVHDWKQESAATMMVPGMGYIIRGSYHYSVLNPFLYETSFNGVPNNGSYELTDIIADRSYLLGNPYPSAIDADTFIQANASVLDGSLYFWTHNTPIAIGTPNPGTGHWAYSGNDYATYTLSGGVGTSGNTSPEWIDTDKDRFVDMPTEFTDKNGNMTLDTGEWIDSNTNAILETGEWTDINTNNTAETGEWTDINNDGVFTLNEWTDTNGNNLHDLGEWTDSNGNSIFDTGEWIDNGDKILNLAAEKASNRPTGRIAAGQGFFASSVSDVEGNVTFTNAMRADDSGNPLDNSNFYKASSPKALTKATIEKHRVWLNLTNKEGAFKQTLVGYIAGATNSLDKLFDGSSYNGNDFLDFYSINDNKKLVIQGRALPFNKHDEVSLGYRIAVAGTYTINIEETDGLLTNQTVFLRDKLTNTITNLKSQNYTFNTAEGTFDERFVLLYTSKTLETKALMSVYNKVLVSIKSKHIKVNAFSETIDKVSIYDLLGKKIYYNEKINCNKLSIPNYFFANHILIIKTTLQNGITVSNKIML